MKKIILIFILLFSGNVFAKKCSDYFSDGEVAYLNAVDFNKQANEYMKVAIGNLKDNDVGQACGGFEIATTHYNTTLELISNATFEMMGASRNCLLKKDKVRARENLDMLKVSAAKVKTNVDKGINLHKQYCE